jgi:hypothetical protein
VPGNPIRLQTAQPRSATRLRCFFSSFVKDLLHLLDAFADPAHDRDRHAIAECLIPWTIGCLFASPWDGGVVVRETLQPFAFPRREAAYRHLSNKYLSMVTLCARSKRLQCRRNLKRCCTKVICDRIFSDGISRWNVSLVLRARVTRAIEPGSRRPEGTHHFRQLDDRGLPLIDRRVYSFVHSVCETVCNARYRAGGSSFPLFSARRRMP